MPLPLPSRPIKAISTTTPTAFNSSQVDELEFKEERGRLSNESEVKEEEDNITQANEFLNKDLEELGQDRLDKEEINKSDIKKEVSEEFKTSKYFRQLIIDSKGNLSLPFKKVVNTLTYSSYAYSIYNNISLLYYST